MSGNIFTIQKRRYSRNDFAGHFYGRFEPEASGTRIEGYFDSPLWARWFMRIWPGAAILLGIPVFVSAVIEIVRGGIPIDGGAWVGLIVPPSLILFGLVLPRFGRLLGKKDERFILGHVQSTLAARIEGDSPDHC